MNHLKDKVMEDASLVEESAMFYEQTSEYLLSSHSVAWCLLPKTSKTQFSAYQYQIAIERNTCFALYKLSKHLVIKITGNGDNTILENKLSLSSEYTLFWSKLHDIGGHRSVLFSQPH